jgi:hypothetical protein
MDDHTVAATEAGALLPDLLICRPELAGDVLTAVV